MFQYPYSFLAPEGRNSRLSVLIFHRIQREVDPLFPGEPTAASFDALLGNIKNWFNVIPLQAAVVGLAEGHLPSRPLCISFDDGYADNCEVALPVLKKHGLTASFFIATGYLDGGCMFNDKIVEAVRGCGADALDLSPLSLGVYAMGTIENKRQAIDALLGTVKYIPSPDRERITGEICRLAGVSVPLDLMMSRGQVREMYKAGMGIGGHTRHHPILARAAANKAMQEIADGKSDVEEIIGAPVNLFAYPNGKPGVDYLSEHVAMVREAGFLAAVSTAKGVAAYGADLFQLPRFTPWDQGALKFGIRMGANLRTRTYDKV